MMQGYRLASDEQGPQFRSTLSFEPQPVVESYRDFVEALRGVAGLWLQEVLAKSEEIKNRKLLK